MRNCKKENLDIFCTCIVYIFIYEKFFIGTINKDIVNRDTIIYDFFN